MRYMKELIEDKDYKLLNKVYAWLWILMVLLCMHRGTALQFVSLTIYVDALVLFKS
jgi:hypothetical protein